jgi:hypothetical protein
MTYTRAGVSVKYVELSPDALAKETTRLVGVIHAALRGMKQLRGHALVNRARYQLETVLNNVAHPAEVDNQVLEVGRLNQVLQSALDCLNRMTTQHRLMNEVRFTLRFGQTAKKRESGWNSSFRSRRRGRSSKSEDDGEGDSSEYETSDYEPEQ